jgi:hypothetical protein
LINDNNIHYGIDDEEAKMPMALQTQLYEGVKISKANTRCMGVSNTMTSSSRETPADDTTHILYVTTLKKIGFERDEGQLKEWMTVVMDSST